MPKTFDIDMLGWCWHLYRDWVKKKPFAAWRHMPTIVLGFDYPTVQLASTYGTLLILFE